jgi:hypothetical protein
MGDLLLRSLTETAQRLSEMVARFLPRLMAMAIIIIAGCIVAWILKAVVRRVLRLLKFDRISETTGFTQLLTKSALPSPAELLGRLVFWIVWVAFILIGVSALDIPALNNEIERFFNILPQIFVAILILFVGVLIANFFGRAALLGAVNASAPSPRLLSSIVRFLIIALAATMALERIGLGQGVVRLAFSIAFGAVMFGLALAFGLGGRDAARRLIEKQFLEEKKKEDDEGISQL